MIGWGIQYFGVSSWGSVESLSPQETVLVGDFNFKVVATEEGHKIKITLTTPSSDDSPGWSRYFRILRKRSEWPQSFDDTDVEIVADTVEPGSVDYTYVDEGLISGENYYYKLFLLGTDGVWYSGISNQDSAYPYSRWGLGDSMYQSLPRGWRSHDTSKDLYNFLGIIGSLADDIKTDCEYLKTLFSINDVHEDLILIADSKIGWPTWLHAGGIHKRRDSAAAVDTYKRIGTEYGYAQLVETATDWELTTAWGWQYIMWSNIVQCTTPDLSDPEIRKDLNGPNDRLKYTNDVSRWQSFTGLGFYLTEIPGVSGPFTQDMWDRVLFLIEWGKASYVVYQVRLVPISEEEYPAEEILDDYEDI